MYHDVSESPTKVSGGPAFFDVSKRSFEQQLNMIEDAGLAGCTIEDALRGDAQGCLAISFDDGGVGQYQFAFPALVERRMSATFFITTSWVGRRGFVGWEQLREMKSAGMSIQSHTDSHPLLSELNAVDLERELTRSKMLLDEHLDQQTDSISLPGGDFPRPALSHIFSDVGYRVVATSRWGVNRAQLLPLRYEAYVHRCTVRGELSETQFRKVLNADRWLHIRRSIRERFLGTVRARIGPNRYHALRRRFLDLIGR